MSTTWGSPCCSRNTSCCLSWSEGAERERLYRGAPSFLLLVVGQLRARGWLRPTSLVSRDSETLEFGPPLNPRGRGERAERRKFRPHHRTFLSKSSVRASLVSLDHKKEKRKMNRARTRRRSALEARRRGEEGKIVVPNRVSRRCRPSVRVR